MAYQVYRVKSADRARLDAALGDDLLSRQSLRVLDARHFGQAGDAIYFFVEGSDAGVLRADALVLEFAERAPDAESLYRMLKDEDDAAASGLGAIFG
jgi:hypothetical protein